MNFVKEFIKDVKETFGECFEHVKAGDKIVTERKDGVTDNDVEKARKEFDERI